LEIGVSSMPAGVFECPVLVAAAENQVAQRSPAGS
jgi:hypothetical protein